MNRWTTSALGIATAAALTLTVAVPQAEARIRGRNVAAGVAIGAVTGLALGALANRSYGREPGYAYYGAPVLYEPYGWAPSYAGSYAYGPAYEGINPAYDYGAYGYAGPGVTISFGGYNPYAEPWGYDYGYRRAYVAPRVVYPRRGIYAGYGGGIIAPRQVYTRQVYMGPGAMYGRRVGPGVYGAPRVFRGAMMGGRGLYRGGYAGPRFAAGGPRPAGRVSPQYRIIDRRR